MIVVYHDVGGSHSSATAANIHINRLPYDEIPDKKDLLSLPTFDKLERNQRGHLIYIGMDEYGSSVYTISRQYKPNLVIPAIIDMYKAVNGDTKHLYIVNTSPTVNTLMKIGGFSSRRLGLVSFGRPIAAYGTLKAYNDIVEVVKKVKYEIKKDTQL